MNNEPKQTGDGSLAGAMCSKTKWPDEEFDYESDEENCEMCGGDGVIEYLDHPEVWGEDCPSYENHLLPCPECQRREFAERRKANPPNKEVSQGSEPLARP